jgi:hypothetical protein
MKRLIFGLMAVTGLFVAVCTADGSPNETWFRAGGTAVFALSAWAGGWFREEKTTGAQSTNNKKQTER